MCYVTEECCCAGTCKHLQYSLGKLICIFFCQNVVQKTHRAYDYHIFNGDSFLVIHMAFYGCALI